MDWAVIIPLLEQYGPQAYALIKKIIENWKKPKTNLVGAAPCPLDEAIDAQVAALSKLLDLKLAQEECCKEGA